MIKRFQVSKETLTLTQDFISSLCEENNVDMKISTKIAVCTDEIISNVVYYSGADFIDVDCNIQNSSAQIEFIDNGKKFNPLTDSEEPDVTANVEDRKIGGLGIFMVKKMMNDVQYKRENNTNRLKISINL